MPAVTVRMSRVNQMVNLFLKIGLTAGTKGPQSRDIFLSKLKGREVKESVFLSDDHEILGLRFKGH